MYYPHLKQIESVLGVGAIKNPDIFERPEHLPLISKMTALANSIKQPDAHSKHMIYEQAIKTPHDLINAYNTNINHHGGKGVDNLFKIFEKNQNNKIISREEKLPGIFVVKRKNDS